MKFKIIFRDEVRRFSVEKTPTWFDFWQLLSHEIFSRKEEFHPELYLQYTDNEGDTITVSTSKEYEEMINNFGESLVKLNIVEGKGGYFKDGPPAIPIALYQQINKISGLYSTFIQTPKSTWIPWESISISNSHDLVTLSNFPIFSPVINGVSLSWEGEDISSNNIISRDDEENDRKNHTSGELSFDAEGTSFEGWIIMHTQFPFKANQHFEANEKYIIKGIRMKHVEEENLKEGYLENVKERVPKFLQSLFKGGRILPHHIPDWLSAAVSVKPLVSEHQNNFVDDNNPFGGGDDPIVDLDIDLNKFYLAVHQKALDLLDQKEFSNAEEFFLIAIEVSPTSTVAHYNLACVYSLSSNYHLAVQYLQKAINLGYSDLSHILSDSDLSPLHSYPPFNSLLATSFNHHNN